MMTVFKYLLLRRKIGHKRDLTWFGVYFPRANSEWRLEATLDLFKKRTLRMTEPSLVAATGI